MTNIVTLLVLSSFFWGASTDDSVEYTSTIELQKLEETLLRSLPASRHNQFHEAKSAWQTYSDIECLYRELNFPMLTTVEECNRSMVHKRAIEVRHHLRWLHGLPGNVQ
ncbi:hypothetical protein [Ochrobactrum sp. AN78]|uniref:hypothetical protein n=1 Tax=Ochrobactrum sp. AN78 TaxID=3039853 RepID=UPI0021F72783|nr:MULTISPECIES: hypothetical protein [Brucella/Ochrobactrum group]MCV9908508.1 hypothetical protein [Brucella sp. HL-2]MDH7790476.1 hypothetical protein [Ochrobactrum sp. AN78]